MGGEKMKQRIFRIAIDIVRKLTVKEVEVVMAEFTMTQGWQNKYHGFVHN